MVKTSSYIIRNFFWKHYTSIDQFSTPNKIKWWIIFKLVLSLLQYSLALEYFSWYSGSKLTFMTHKTSAGSLLKGDFSKMARQKLEWHKVITFPSGKTSTLGNWRRQGFFLEKRKETFNGWALIMQQSKRPTITNKRALYSSTEEVWIYEYDIKPKLIT